MTNCHVQNVLFVGKDVEGNICQLKFRAQAFKVIPSK